MTRDKSDKTDRNCLTKPAGHVLLPVAMITALSLILAGGFELLGLLRRVNAGIARVVSRDGAENFPQHLAQWWLWLASAVFAGGLAAAMLGSPGHGRRALLWFSAVVVVAAWAPVLSLAAYAPEIGAPWIATLWSGGCAMVYAANHRMACDGSRRPPAFHNHPSPDDPR